MSGQIEVYLCMSLRSLRTQEVRFRIWKLPAVVMLLGMIPVRETRITWAMHLTHRIIHLEPQGVSSVLIIFVLLFGAYRR